MRELPGYDPDVAKSREKARAIMAAQGYGPDKRLKLKLSTRNLPTYRDASVILISQLKEIFIDAELQLVETAQWVPKLIRRDYQIGAEPGRQRRRRPRPELSGELRLRLAHLHGLLQQGDRRPDRQAVGRARPGEAQADRLGDRPQADQDAVRPMIYYMRGGTCWRPEVKNMTIMVNSIYNGWRMEDVWLDR